MSEVINNVTSYHFLTVFCQYFMLTVIIRCHTQRLMCMVLLARGTLSDCTRGIIIPRLLPLLHIGFLALPLTIGCAAHRRLASHLAHSSQQCSVCIHDHLALGSLNSLCGLALRDEADELLSVHPYLRPALAPVPLAECSACRRWTSHSTSGFLIGRSTPSQPLAGPPPSLAEYT